MPIQTTYPLPPPGGAAPAPVVQQGMDPAARRDIIRALAASNNQPVRHPLEIASRMAQAWALRNHMEKAAEAENLRKDVQVKGLVDALVPRGDDPGVSGPGRAAYAGAEAGLDTKRQGLAAALRGNDTAMTAATTALFKREFPGPESPETYGQPVGAVGPDGKPTFFRAGNRGAVRPVSGYAPPPKEPKSPTTPAQGANNLEILDARAQVEALRGQLASQLGHVPSDSELGQEILKRSTRQDPLTGMPQVDYNSNLMMLARRAAQRRVGADDRAAERYVSALGALDAGAGPESAATSPAAEPEGEGFLAKILQTLGYGGREAEAGPAAPPAPAESPVDAGPLAGDPAAAPVSPAPAQGTEESPFQPQSQADYDAVPSGALFINPADGKLKRKP